MGSTPLLYNRRAANVTRCNFACTNCAPAAWVSHTDVNRASEVMYFRRTSEKTSPATHTIKACCCSLYHSRPCAPVTCLQHAQTVQLFASVLQAIVHFFSVPQAIRWSTSPTPLMTSSAVI
jgi:hypothetical protein